VSYAIIDVIVDGSIGHQPRAVAESFIGMSAVSSKTELPALRPTAAFDPAV